MNLRALVIPLGALLFTGCFEVASKTCNSGLVCPAGTVCSGDGTNCISAAALCGNGQLDSLPDGTPEKCDDGNISNGDDCRADCRGNGKCGDGTVDADLFHPDGGPLELCDDGNRTLGDGCNLDCQQERCGNAIIDMQADGGLEPCDDGANSLRGDGCRSNCTRELCGDGEVDRLPDGGSEGCDDGNTMNGDDCSATCVLERCPNGVIDMLRDGGSEECDDQSPSCGTSCLLVRCGNKHIDDGLKGNEVCDDGNLDGGDGCNARCTGEEICGDAYLDPVLKDGGFEICDDGNLDAGDGCSSDCRSNETCGNGTFDPARGELCDDGNTNSGDGCRTDCKGLEVCGDNNRDVALWDGGAEQCDDHNLDAGDGCSPTCRFEVCGNGTLDPRELCDDGNNRPISTNPDGGQGDNCSPDCLAIGSCGNSSVESGLGEQCDNGPNNGDDKACTSGCQLAICGDVLVRAGVEQCDTGTESLTCNVNCTNRRCGDGIINATAGEQCDVPGPVTGTETAICDTDCTVAFCGDSKVNLVLNEQCDTGGNTNSCNSNCRPAVCGDSILNSAHGTAPDGGAPFEQCDTGGNSTYCDSDCSPAVCGDGFFNSTSGEQCDDGNSVNTDDCLSGCRSNTCGDGFRDLQGPSTEACDDGNQITEADCAYGTPTCTVCAGNCQSEPARTGPFCGDNATNGPEVCDDGNSVTETSCAYGTASCTACTGNCAAQFSLTGPRCGDGVQNTANGEACDDGNTTTETSCPYGFASCTLCNANCTAALPLTGIYCGDGVKNGAENCDDGNGLACGTCSADCSIAQPAVEATGRIRAIEKDAFDEGETITLNDGINPPVVFVIKKTAGFDAGTQVPIDLILASGSSTTDAANAIITAVNGYSGGLAITASFNSNHPKVRLNHDQIGPMGNQPISETVTGANAFYVQGMSGGGGLDCATGVGCVVSDDCQSSVCLAPTDGGTIKSCQ